MNNCEYLGCMYNEDGYCKYLNANIKVPAARACNEDDIQALVDEIRYGKER